MDTRVLVPPIDVLKTGFEKPLEKLNPMVLPSMKQMHFLTKAAIIALPLALSGCIAQTLQHGYVVSPEALQQIPIGASQEQVLLALGTPSTVESFQTEGFYYISQKTRKVAAFARGKIVDQRVVAVYFDDEGTVRDVGDFGLKDGQVFDFLKRTTPTSGSEITFLQQVLKAAQNPASARGGVGGPPRP